jgi:predicted RNA-binding protein YlqC (UPF0109 family)
MNPEPPARKEPNSILHKDIKDLEFTRSLRRLGSIRVTEWEFSDVLPAVSRLAHKEVDLVDIFKRTANYRVTDWDFRDLLRQPGTAGEPSTGKTPEEIQTISRQLTAFLAYVTEGLVEQPKHARIRAEEIQQGMLRFKLVLVKRDAAALIGHGGHSAAAIRRLMQDFGHRHGVQVLLQVLSHEEDASTAERPA